jgi:hypothetical protein
VADAEIELPSAASSGEVQKGLKTEIQGDIIQEIEALLGRQSIRDLNFEAVEMAARQALRLAAERWNNGSTLTPPITLGRNSPAPAEGLRSIMAVTGTHLKVYWARCTWSTPIITVQTAGVDSARATAI